MGRWLTARGQKGPETLVRDEVEPGEYAPIIIKWEMTLRLPKPPEFNPCASMILLCETMKTNKSPGGNTG